MLAPVNQRKPAWLSKRLPDAQDLARMRQLLGRLHLHTICESASCPNLGECWRKNTATFLIMGDTCTRHCGFCNVPSGVPLALDEEEPKMVAEAVKLLGLRHAVITSVSRDDLSDAGAAHIAATITAIKTICPDVTVEVLVSDLAGQEDNLKVVLAAAPDVFAHNLETVRSLHRRLRPQYSYERSLQVLARSKQLAPDIRTKSSIMVGLGESDEDVLDSFTDLRVVDCDFLTIGQYLAPSKKHMPVKEYVHPSVFAHYKQQAEAMGFKHVASGPFVRSSYDAAAALAASS